MTHYEDTENGEERARRERARREREKKKLLRSTPSNIWTFLGTKT